MTFVAIGALRVQYAPPYLMCWPVTVCIIEFENCILRPLKIYIGTSRLYCILYSIIFISTGYWWSQNSYGTIQADSACKTLD